MADQLLFLTLNKGNHYLKYQGYTTCSCLITNRWGKREEQFKN